MTIELGGTRSPCPHCAALIFEWDDVCDECGELVFDESATVMCPDCGSDVVLERQPHGPGGLFCPMCGGQPLLRRLGHRRIGWVVIGALGAVAFVLGVAWLAYHAD